MHGSSGLPSADENQLSDPFCVVEAISKNAQKLFVHRTRVIPKKLCPEWSESFYAVVPPGFECQRIMCLSRFKWSGVVDLSIDLAFQSENKRYNSHVIHSPLIERLYKCNIYTY